jgi:eukaryotic-like serine/threonine-protein kinase
MSTELGARADPWKPGDLVAGRYHVVELLGRGAMGVVYRVEETGARGTRYRALKTIRADLPADKREIVLEYFKREAEALIRLENDFVVKLYDAQVEDGPHPFIVMELLRGRDLETVLLEDGPMDAVEAIWLLRQLACALRASHEMKIVHRDLKPANLFLNTRDDGSLELKLIDFSIARLLDRATSKTTIIAGTPGYMATEQSGGWNVDARADIFALGKVARDVLFGLNDDPEVDSVAPTLLSPEKPNVASEDFTRWLARATAADMRDRFGSAVEAVEELAVVLGVPPARPSLSPVSRDARVSKPEIGNRKRSAKRRRLALVASALAVPALMLGVRSLWRKTEVREPPLVASQKQAFVASSGPAQARPVAAPASTTPAVVMSREAPPPAVAKNTAISTRPGGLQREPRSAQSASAPMVAVAASPSSRPAAEPSGAPRTPALGWHNPSDRFDY